GGREGKQRAKQAVVDDDDDEDDNGAAAAHGQQATQTGPIMVYVRRTSPIAVKGQDLYVAIFANGPVEVTSARIGLSFDPNILEVKGVRDAGLMSTGARAELQFQAEAGTVSIQLDRPNGSPGVAARGQVCLVVFTTKNQGQTGLNLIDGQVGFQTTSGQMAGVKLQSSQVEIR